MADSTKDNNKNDVKADSAPKGDKASVNYPGGEASPNAPRRGEVAIDENANTNYVGGDGVDLEAERETADKNREDAKQDGLRNAARERDEQPGAKDKN